MADAYEKFSTGLSSPLRGAFSITPNDTTELTNVTRALYVGGSGDIVVVFEDGSEVTLKNLQAGVWHPMRVRQVKATGTTATDIVGGI